MKSNEYLIYTNSMNESIYFGWQYEVFVTSFNDELDNTINFTKLALQDGYTFNSSTLEARNISFEVKYAIKNAERIEKNIKKIIDIKEVGTLTKVIGKEQYSINVRALSVPTVTRELGIGTISIELQALEPYYHKSQLTEKLAKQLPLFKFPQYFEKTIAFASIVQQVNTDILNAGDVDTGFTVIFKASKGNVTNPSIYNNKTNQMIKINYEMQEGDIIEVVNHPFNKIVYLNGAKKFSILNRKDTKFFNIVRGTNQFGIYADENLNNLEVLLQYEPKFL